VATFKAIDCIRARLLVCKNMIPICGGAYKRNRVAAELN